MGQGNPGSPAEPPRAPESQLGLRYGAWCDPGICPHEIIRASMADDEPRVCGQCESWLCVYCTNIVEVDELVCWECNEAHSLCKRHLCGEDCRWCGGFHWEQQEKCQLCGRKPSERTDPTCPTCSNN